MVRVLVHCGWCAGFLVFPFVDVCVFWGFMVCVFIALLFTLYCLFPAFVVLLLILLVVGLVFGFG